MTTSTARLATFRFHPKLWAAATLLLALPVAAMVVTDELNWGLDDFAGMALMLAGLCTGIEDALNWLKAPRWRIAAIMLGVLLFMTIWAHLAVGLFD